jgi:hypothetical protein
VLKPLLISKINSSFDTAFVTNPCGPCGVSLGDCLLLVSVRVFNGIGDKTFFIALLLAQLKQVSWMPVPDYSSCWVAGDRVFRRACAWCAGCCWYTADLGMQAAGSVLKLGFYLLFVFSYVLVVPTTSESTDPSHRQLPRLTLQRPEGFVTNAV